ncbi:hypothetical protein, partial [uncultured Bilophila sp.]|uniref:hypothetical protein n=1 Tax=uncultured Bilophila sp. TaxID=529385 RepID=UPI0026268AD1
RAFFMARNIIKRKKSQRNILGLCLLVIPLYIDIKQFFRLARVGGILENACVHPLKVANWNWTNLIF